MRKVNGDYIYSDEEKLNLFSRLVQFNKILSFQEFILKNQRKRK